MDTHELNHVRREREEDGVAVLDAPEPGGVRVLPPANGDLCTSGRPIDARGPTPAVPPVSPPARRGASPVVPILIGLGVLLLVGVLAALLILAALGNTLLRNTRTVAVGPLTTWDTSVPLGTAKSARVEINDGVGKLTLAGGAANLLDARFTYNIAEWKPEVNYQVGLSDNSGALTVRQPSTNISAVGTTRYDWDLRLKNNLPLNLKVDLGVGDGNLKLAGLDLTQLEVRTGVGAATVDLSGAWTYDVPITIHNGVGQTRLILPRGTAVQVTTHGGVGKVRADGFHVSGDTYTNDRYGAGGPVLRIDANLGVGDITLEQK